MAAKAVGVAWGKLIICSGTSLNYTILTFSLA